MRKKLDDILERGHEYVLVTDIHETSKGCLLIYSKRQYYRVLEEFHDKVPADSEKGTKFARFYFASAYIICYEGKLDLDSRTKLMVGIEDADEYEVILDESGKGSAFARIFPDYTCCITEFIPVKRGRIRRLFRRIKRRVLREND